MDIKKMAEDAVKKVSSDKDIAAKFQKDPVKTLEGILGVDLPDDQMNQIVTAVKAKVSLGKASDLLGGIFGKKLVPGERPHCRCSYALQGGFSFLKKAGRFLRLFGKNLSFYRDYAMMLGIGNLPDSGRKKDV